MYVMSTNHIEILLALQRDTIVVIVLIFDMNLKMQMCDKKYLLQTYVHHTGHRIIWICIIIYLFVIFNGIIIKLCLKLLLYR